MTSEIKILRRAALAYAQRLGWPVSPAASRGKLPATSRGYYDATTDPDRIAQWWRSRAYNIALACSPHTPINAAGDHLLAVDVDAYKGGDDQLDDLQEQYGELPQTAMQLTGGGGYHYLFRVPAGSPPLQQINLAPAVELRCAGYIIAAPSVHASGRRYAWELSAHPLDTPLATVPAWIVQRAFSLPKPASVPIADVGSSLLALAFRHADMVIERLATYGPNKTTRLAVTCPWERDHSDGRQSKSGSVIFAPSTGNARGWFHCAHAHCEGRTYDDVIAALPTSAVQAAVSEMAAATAEVDQDVERAAIMAEGCEQ